MISGILLGHVLRERGWVHAGSCGMPGHIDCLLRAPEDRIVNVHEHGLGCTADICGPIELVCPGACRTTGLECVGHPLPTREQLVAATIARRLNG